VVAFYLGDGQVCCQDVASVVWPWSAASVDRSKEASREAGTAPVSQGSRAVPHGESKWQKEVGRPGRASSTP
jgi:hypothetical protein